MQINHYMMFTGQCREAFDFYAKALGVPVAFAMTYGESPMAGQCEDGQKDWIMHTQIEGGGVVLMGADGPQIDVPAGGGTVINIAVDTPEEAERVFAALLEGGSVTMPIEETFWAHRWGMLVDRYGKPWMVNCMKPM